MEAQAIDRAQERLAARSHHAGKQGGNGGAEDFK